jgi:hypothetical protein
MAVGSAAADGGIAACRFVRVIDGAEGAVSVYNARVGGGDAGRITKPDTGDRKNELTCGEAGRLEWGASRIHLADGDRQG